MLPLPPPSHPPPSRNLARLMRCRSSAPLAFRGPERVPDGRAQAPLERLAQLPRALLGDLRQLTLRLLLERVELLLVVRAPQLACELKWKQKKTIIGTSEQSVGQSMSSGQSEFRPLTCTYDAPHTHGGP